MRSRRSCSTRHTAAKINKTSAALVASTLTEIYSTSPGDITDVTLRLENGFSLTGALSDPETDSHPFSSAST